MTTISPDEVAVYGTSSIPFKVPLAVYPKEIEFCPITCTFTGLVLTTSAFFFFPQDIVNIVSIASPIIIFLLYNFIFYISSCFQMYFVIF